MKKLITVILLSVFMGSFYLTYTDFKENKIHSMKNEEYTLDNVKTAIIPSKIREKQYETLLESAKVGASLYFTRIEHEGGKEKIIKYIHTNNDEYVKKFKLKKGRYLTVEDGDSDKYLSTIDNDDPNQVGLIETIDGFEMEIKTLRGMLNDEYILNGECLIQLNDGVTIEDYGAIFKDGDSGEIISYDAKSVESISQKGIIQVVPLLIILIVVVLYYLIWEYKKIAIEKMIGYSSFTIWSSRIKKILVISIVTMIISVVLMSLLMVKEWNFIYLEFLMKLSPIYLIMILGIIIASTIPFIYVESIKIISMLKNKKNIKELLILNMVVKVILSIGLVTLIIFQLKEYNGVKDIFNNNFMKWEESENYKVLWFNNLEIENMQNKEWNENIINAYKEFNKKGALLVEFKGYSEGFLSMNSDSKDYEFYAVVNPNYIKENKAYDINGEEIIVDETNKNVVILVPEKYKKDEKKIKKWYGCFSKDANTGLEIIWMKNGQEFFSYDFSVKVDNGNKVKEPILWIVPEESPFSMFFGYLVNTEGSPVKIKGEDDWIMSVLEKNKLKAHGPQINYANEQLAGRVEGFKGILKWALLGGISSLLVILFLMIQNISNYMEQYKRNIAIKKMIGQGYVEKYKGYFGIVLISWIIVGVVSIFLERKFIVPILIISILGFLLELIIDFIGIKILEGRKILRYIKGGL